MADAGPSRKRSKASRPNNSKKDRYLAILSQKEIPSTKFFDWGTLRSLGIGGMTEGLLQHAGFANFHHLSARTYKHVTLEFLSTFDYRSTDEGHLTSLSFTYLDNRYEMTAAEVRAAFGIRVAPSANWSEEAVGENPQIWWHVITGGAYSARHSYNYQIPNPAIQLCHMVFAMCFCGKGEVNKVPATDLQYLWATAMECPIVPDWAGLFVARCAVARTSDKGKITMGGMISLLVSQFVDLSPLNENDSPDPPLPGSPVYSLGWLCSYKLIYTLARPDGWLWPYGKDGEFSIFLPNATPYGPSNTLCLPAVDTEGMVLKNPGRPRRRAPVPQAEEPVPAPAQPASVPQPTEWDNFYQRLDQRLVQSENTMAGHFAGLSDRMGRLELHQQALQREMSVVQQGYRDVTAEQTRARASFDGYYTFVEEQWRQYWSMHPPPPPPDQF